MKIALPYGSKLTDAFKLASERGILPTWMGTAEIKELEDNLKARAVFSARTTHADYLQALRAEINKLVEGGYGSTEAEIRAALKAKLREVGYDPLTGFPGDAELGIPPARPGSLQDLGGDRRINLILDTQIQILAGKGQQQRGMEPAALDLFPAYELVRVKRSRVPRDWLKRWAIAADNVDWKGVSREAFEQGRMIALKTSPVWPALGSSALFDDVLDVSHPPFAFGSGMGWDVRDREEAEGFGLRLFSEDPELEDIRLPPPPPVKSVNGLDRDFVDALTRKLDRAELRDGKLTLQGSVESAVQRALERRKARVNALLLELDVAALKVELNTFQRREHTPKRSHQDGNGKRCGRGWIAKDKVCRKAVDVLSGDEPLTAQEAADALDQAPHHHLRDVLRHWFDRSFKRLNREAGSKESRQLQALVRRIQPTPHATPLLRGLRFRSREELAAFAAQAAKKGLTSPLNAFSKKPEVALRFAEPHDTDEGRYNALIRISRSKSGRYMRPLAEEVHGKVAHQEEFLFLGDTPVKVLGSRYDATPEGGTFILDLAEE